MHVNKKLDTIEIKWKMKKYMVVLCSKGYPDSSIIFRNKDYEIILGKKNLFSCREKNNLKVFSNEKFNFVVLLEFKESR